MNLNNIQLKDFMCGCLLGNSNLNKKYQNSTFYEYAPERYKEYLLWKTRTIEHNLDTEFRYEEHIHNGTICRIQSRTHKYFTQLYDTFYQDSRKIFPFRFIDKYFDNIGLAVLYMDCGHTSWRKQYGTIKMCEIAPRLLTPQSAYELQEILMNKFNIYSTLSCNNVCRIRIYGSNIEVLLQIISPIVQNVPCMRHKVSFDDYMNVS